MLKAPKSIEVGLDLKIFKITGTWEPNNVEREAAWELYVELITRIAVVPLQDDEGILREALTSLHALFGITREILRRHGPDIAEPKPNGQYNFGYLSVVMLNVVIRPILAHWHPLLESWESTRPKGRSKMGHEQLWEHADALREELKVVQTTLAQYALILATACGIPDLSAAIPSGHPTALS
jgi:hypothetical protein